MTRREMDRFLLMEHEKRMQRPPKEIFPPTGPQMTSVCRHCKKTYTRSAYIGKKRDFCGGICRDAFVDARTGRKHSARAPQFRFPGAA